MRTIRDLAALRARVHDWKGAGESVAIVPTMGALHAGHLSLVNAARAACDHVIVTLFVNPTQFNNPDDLKTYPRTEESDAALLAPLGVDVLFAPDTTTIYPPGFATTVAVPALAGVLCGAHRPGHFDGVATVVTKLLLMSGADHAFFGEKDWQQLQIIRRLTLDLNIPTQIRGCPTLRDTDGLAMSSRNTRLSQQDRARAPALFRALSEAATQIARKADIAAALDIARTTILKSGFDSVEYLDLRGGDDLSDSPTPRRKMRLFVAAWLGGVRLIDNVAVG